MKKNNNFAQSSVLSEVLMIYTTRDIADGICDRLSNKDVELTVYETTDDGIILRKRKDGIITDDGIIKAISKTVKKLIEKTVGKDDDIYDIIADNYEFEYDADTMMSESFFSRILNIRRSGGLIYIEIDIQ